MNKVAVLTKAALKTLSSFTSKCQGHHKVPTTPGTKQLRLLPAFLWHCPALPAPAHSLLAFPSPGGARPLQWPSCSCASNVCTQHGQQEWLKLPLKRPRDQLCTCAAFKYNQPALLVCLLDSQLTFFFYHLHSQQLSFSPSKRFSYNDSPRSRGFQERKPNLPRHSAQIRTSGSSGPSPTAEMLSAAGAMLQ